MGNSRYIQGNYNKEYIGKDFRFDKFNIILNQTNKSYMNDGLFIYLDNICVLSYYFKNNKIHVIDGKWMDIIDYISNEIPNYKELKNNNIEETIINQNLYYSLVDYINVFLENDNVKTDVKDYMNERLFDNSILIRKETSFYSLFYNDEEVLRFSCTSHINTDDLNIYRNYFKAGNWINGFIEAINSTNEYSYILKKEKTDDISDNIIRKLKK